MCSTILIISDKQRRVPSRKVSKEKGNVKMLFAGSLAEAREWIAGEAVDLTLIALKGQHDETFALVRQSLENNQETRVMFFANDKELTTTLNALAKLQPEQLKTLLSPNAASGTAKSLPFALQKSPGDASSQETVGLFTENELVGNSPEMEKLKVLMLKIAPTGTTIMIQGESGTGKEIIARTIHNHSSRKNGVFIPVDCAAMNAESIERELFGYSKGEFSESDSDTLGLIRAADNGTLFLDEIAELPIAVQEKILLTIQNRAVQPVGSSKKYPVDIRIIATSSCDLAKAVKNGAFYQDLYDHLNAITLYAPALREHRTDIPLLCTYFINKLFYEGYPKKQLTKSAISALCAYDWPGNIREVENVIRSAVTHSDGGLIESAHITFSGNNNNTETEDLASLVFHEKEAIRKALKIKKNNKSAAAELLGISEARLSERLKM